MRILFPFLLSLLLVAGCDNTPTSAGGDGHAHDDAHAHDEDAMRVVTHVTDGSELFVEFPSLVAGH
ncbi:MAG TPA: hypothetical protein ENN42_08735, partial [Thioalkalivibrio sp.]|nr:hypothetical protein [Thioalkalivibrio sp.]